LLCQDLFIAISVVLLLFIPKLDDLFSFEVLDGLFFANKGVSGIKPGIELIVSGLSLASSANICIPCLHISKSFLEFFLGPNKQNFLGLLVFTQNDELWNTFHVVLNIDYCIYAEIKVLGL